MKWTFFSDLHLGGSAVKEERFQLFLSYLEQARRENAQIVFLGDIYELDTDPDVPRKWPKFHREYDLWIPGNHDPYPLDGVVYREYFQDDERLVFGCHGDELDFQYVFALLEHRPPFFLKWLPFQREHARSLYQAMIEGRISARNLVFGRKPNFTTYLALVFQGLTILTRHPVRIYPEIQDFQPVPGPLIKPDAEIRLKRIQTLWPQARSARLVVHGHTHYPTVYKINGTWIVDLGSWETTPIVLIYDQEDRSVLMRSPDWSRVQFGPGVGEEMRAEPDGFRFYLELPEGKP